jgi:hypothetical protein
MKKSCLNDWLAALRSNNYTKCIGALHRESHFCPLGILCDISKLDTWKENPFGNKDNKYYFGKDKYLPDQVMDWARINREEYNFMTAFVMVLNDVEKLSLIEMADRLEFKYRKLSS